MAAYAALVSVMQIIHQIEHHPSPPISMDKKQVESLTEIVMFLQEFLEGYKSPYADGDEADPLEMRIADAIYAAEDVIESHIVEQLRSDVLVLYEALRNVIDDMDLIVAVKERMLLRQVADISISAELNDTLWDLMQDIRLVEERVTKHMDLIITLKYHLQRQVSDSADLYKTVVKVIQHLDFIKNEVMVIFAFKDQLQRQFLAFADKNIFVIYNKSDEVDFIEDVDLLKNEVMEIFAFKDQLQQGQVLSPSVNSSTYAETQAYFRKDMDLDLDLIKKDMMEIIEVKDQLEIQVSASSDSSASADFHESFQKVVEDMYLIKKEVMEMVALKDHTQVSGGSSTSSFSRPNSTTMVGFDYVKIQLMEKLIYGQPGRQVIPIVGMGGIGKTTLATNVYEHPSIGDHFDICAWVTISQQFSLKELLGEILFQANKQRLSEMREDEIGLSLHKWLSHRRYLIVLDDMWSIEAWEKIQLYFPDNGNCSRIMVTTRLSNLGSQLNNNYSLEMEFMNEESSWNMFSKIVFGGKSCPLELEKIGKKIVESCRGLPLSIVVMGGLLEKLERTTECWESIRECINSLVNWEDGMHCLKILKLSYSHLPVNLKPCFLYLGMFEEDSEIQVSSLIKLWVSEGFLKSISGKSLETTAKDYLDELVKRNLILVHKLGYTGNVKYCKIHDLIRDLCLREAQKERFYDVVGQGTCSQRRVVILRSTPKEKVVDAMKSRPYARTYISDRERVQMLPNLRLLRTLKAHDSMLSKGHDYSLGKLLELVNLRLLVVYSEKYSTQLPSSINLLWSLQTLMIATSTRVMIATSTRDIDAPVEIWNMPQLRHVHVQNGTLHLQYPPSDSIIIMENLQTLKGVCNFKCDEMMIRRIPNIKKLGLYYSEDEATEFHDDDSCVHNIERLQKLESFSCYCFRRCDFLQNLTFPNSLKSLTLAIKYGRNEDILEKVSTLPLLQKLKLKNGSFTTGKWDTAEGQFPSLKFLSLDYCRHLEWWTIESSHFPCLEHLRLLCMFDLKEIPAEVGEIPTLKSVVLSDCSESAVKSAKRMVEEQEELQGQDQLSFKVEVRLGFWLRNNEEIISLANPNFQFTTPQVVDRTPPHLEQQLTEKLVTADQTLAAEVDSFNLQFF